MSIPASIGARLAHAGRRIRAWSWPSRLGMLGGGVVGELIVYECYVWSAACMWFCLILIEWGDAIEERRRVQGAKQ